MTDLDKAREWAESVGNIEGLMPGTRATVEVIQSLPDQWVDVEEVREVINGQLSVYTRGTASHYIAEEITRKLKEALIAPKLPTLADMTQEERKARRWMQATVIDGEKAARGIIQDVYADVVWVMFQSGFRNNYRLEDVTPLPDLPRLKWPGSEVERPRLPEGMRLADHEEYGRVVVSPEDDLDGDYRVFCSQDHTEYGADWWYAHKSELTFLDGGQHV